MKCYRCRRDVPWREMKIRTMDLGHRLARVRVCLRCAKDLSSPTTCRRCGEKNTDHLWKGCRRIPLATQHRILELQQQGVLSKYIACRLGLHVRTVVRYWDSDAVPPKRSRKRKP